MIPWLDEIQPSFPPVETALDDPQGLLAAGGNLNTTTLINAYRNGIFPWFNEDDPILWWSPTPRCVLFPQDIYLSKSLRKTLRKRIYKVTANTAFEEVIHACSETRKDQEGTWITDDMIDAYVEAHHQGVAHSIEVWKEDMLIGGLYGIAIGRVFFGESMFSRASDASKVALAHLCHALDNAGFDMIDCQVESPHLLSLGACTIDRSAFQEALLACDKEAKHEPWNLIGESVANLYSLTTQTRNNREQPNHE